MGFVRIPSVATAASSRPRNSRIAILGPSHAANHFNTSGSTGFPASFNASAMGPVHWANILSGGRAVLESADCFGWNGDRSSPDAGYPGELSRIDAVIASGGLVLAYSFAFNECVVSAAPSIMWSEG